MDKCLRPQIFDTDANSEKVLESGFIGKGHLRVSLEELMEQLIETNLTF